MAAERQRLIFHVSCPPPSLRSFWIRSWDVWQKIVLQIFEGVAVRSTARLEIHRLVQARNQTPFHASLGHGTMATSITILVIFLTVSIQGK